MRFGLRLVLSAEMWCGRRWRRLEKRIHMRRSWWMSSDWRTFESGMKSVSDVHRTPSFPDWGCRGVQLLDFVYTSRPVVTP